MTGRTSTDPRARDALGDGQGGVQVRNVDQIEAAQLFARLGVGTVMQRIAVS